MGEKTTKPSTRKQTILRPQDWALLSAVSLTGLLAISALLVHHHPARAAVSHTVHTVASSRSHAPALHSDDGYLEATSNADVATLIVRDSSGDEERVDCSPDTSLLTLTPGRYHVRIEGVPHRVIARDRVVEIRPGKTVYLGPDQ
ncbi:MAG TPA: hypothetical protein VFJ58_03855 [Armatimonadota bacterium]|nr:hypothetical protein [Armatimonadota bacterium]